MLHDSIYVKINQVDAELVTVLRLRVSQNLLENIKAVFWIQLPCN